MIERFFPYVCMLLNYNIRIFGCQE